MTRSGLVSRRFSALVVCVCAPIAALALGSVPAWAVEGHTFDTSFTGTTEHPLSKPKGVAIDQKTGQVYVVNSAEDDVEVFSASGGFEKVFGKKGTVKGDFEEPTEVAVDNSSVVSSTLMEGDVAVLDGKNKRVEIFNAEGTALKEITKTEINAVEGDGSKGGLKSIAGVAIDGSGDLWIWTSKSGEGGVVAMYELPAGGSLEFRYEDDSVVGEGLAVTLAGNILAGNGVAVSQTGPAGESFEGVGTFEGATGGVAGVAVDPDNGGVYLSRGVEVAHFPAPTSAGAGRSDSFGTLGAGELSAGSGVAVSAFTGYEHYVYVADSGANLVDVYTPVTLATASLKPAANVQETTAELSGEVNPEGMAVSACEFEYGTSEGQYTNTVPCSSLPGSGSSFVKVSASLTGLTVGIHYYARLSVTDANGTSYAQPLDAFETVHRLEIKTEGSGSVECEEVEHEHKRCEYEYGYPSGILLLLKANPDPGSSFVEWKEGSGRAAACDGPSEECEFRTGFEPVSITAVFTSGSPKTYALSVMVTPSGGGTVLCNTGNGPESCASDYTEGTTVKLTETPGANYTFEGWSEACTGTTTCEVTMSGAKSVTAKYKAIPKKYALSVTVTPLGDGTVDCSTGGSPGPCASEYTEGETVKLTEKENTGYTFEGWSEACTGTTTCEVTMSGAKSVTAKYKAVPKKYALTATIAPPGSGTVDCSTGGSPGPCASEYTEGETVKLTEKENTGYTFEGWSEACTGTTTCEVTMSGAKSVTAKYKAVPKKYALTATIAPPGSGTVECSVEGGPAETCAVEYLEGTNVEVIQHPEAGYEFEEWSGGCSGTGVCSVTMSGPKSVTATFNKEVVAENQPVFKQCVKLYKNAYNEYEGKYSGKYCESSEIAGDVASEGKYELRAPAALEGAPSVVTGKSRSVVIVTTGEGGGSQVVVCGKSTLDGTLENSGHEGRVRGTLTFEKCVGKSNGKEAPCENAVNVLEKPVIDTEFGAGSAVTRWLGIGETKPGVVAPSGLERFHCGTEQVAVNGALIGTLVNTTEGMSLVWSIGGPTHSQADDSYWIGGTEITAFPATHWYTGAEVETVIAGIEALKTEVKGISVRNESEGEGK